MQQIDWYFDFISPYAYLQFHRLAELPASATLHLKPVLFAGLLNHWGNVGPAEISSKRCWTYQHILWLAHQTGLPLRMPSSHPFNPLPLLRLAVLLDCQPAVVERLFAYVWQAGHTPQEQPAFEALLAEFGVRPEHLAQAEIKQRLQENGEQAVAAGVFGVPTAVVDGKLFWGVDSQAMLRAYLQQDPFFDSPAYLQAGETPIGTARPRPANT